MTPVSPVSLNADLPEVIFGRDQPEFMPLPAVVTDEGCVVSRWALSEDEKKQVLETGSIWLMLWTGGRPVQPSCLMAECPVKLRED